MTISTRTAPSRQTSADAPDRSPAAAPANVPWRYAPLAATCLIVALFAAGTVSRARQKIFWHDEIFTVLIAQLPVGELWPALRAGVDLSPPGFHLLAKANHTIFGDGHIATRLPAAAGVLCAAICAGIFVRRRHGAVAGLVAIVLLLSTEAYLYAYEARPYGLVLGFAGLVFVCWQAAIRRGPRRIWLLGLFLSLAAAMSMHYYAVLLFAPIAAGEGSRLWTRRRPDWPLWIAAGASIVAIVISLPLIAAVSEYSAGHFSRPGLRTVFSSYESTMAMLAVSLVMSLVFAGAAAIFWSFAEPPLQTPDTDMRHEWIAAAVLVLLPFLTYLLAILWTGALVSRYYLTWTLGLSILVPATVARLARRPERILVSCFCALFAWFGLRQVLSARWLAHDGPSLQDTYPLLFDKANQELPIVIGHPHVFLVAVHYAPPALERRLVTLLPSDAPPEADTAIRSFRALSRIRPLPLADFNEFIARHGRFLVYGPPSDYVVLALGKAGATLALLGQDEDTQLFPTSRPGPYSLFLVTTTPERRRAHSLLPAVKGGA